MEKLFWEGERKGKESEADQPVGVQGLEYIFVYCLSRDNSLIPSSSRDEKKVISPFSIPTR